MRYHNRANYYTNSRLTKCIKSLAAIAAGIELDFGINLIKNGFKNFHGVKRRFRKVGEYLGASIIDDYAHHPFEVIATLNTAWTIAHKQNGKVIIFQPHRFSRLENLFKEFTACFDFADKVYITDVYAAGEQPIAGISGSTLVQQITETLSHNDVHFFIHTSY